MTRTTTDQVLERFAESGWQPFVAPAETYEFFAVSGVFKRASVDAPLYPHHHAEAVGGSSGGAPHHIAQRNALFDVCVKSGLAHLIVAYVRAEEASATAFGGAKNYVLKEPIAVQQWVRRRIESIERAINEMVAEQQFHVSHSQEEANAETLAEDVRQLNGMRMIAMALVERLKDGSREFSRAAMVANGDVAMENASALEETELARLTTAGIQHLLELLTQIQSLIEIAHCLIWLDEHTSSLSVDPEAYTAFYEQARALRASYREQFEEVYGSNLSSVSGQKDAPMVLIELVMQSAGLHPRHFGGGSCPPTRVGQLVQLLRIPSIQEDVVAFYSSEMDREPIEGYFRVQVAVVLYFCLDRAYLGKLAPQIHTGAQLAHQMRGLADSLAAELCVRDDMKLTLLALWLIENAGAVKTSSSDHVAAIYEYAIGLLQQSSAMHLHQKYDLETDLILHILETLVHRGECVFAWKVWNTFGLEFDQSLPAAAVEMAVVISLELDLWERALTLIRSQTRQDLLPLVFQWLTKTHRLKELVQGVTFLPEEESGFHAFMMDHSDVQDEERAVLHYDAIKRVDLLIMYYILRHKYKEAWDVHHEHLALIRSATSGDTQVASSILNEASFQIRSALLSNMCAEPTPRQYRHKSSRSTSVSGSADIHSSRQDADQPMRLIGAANYGRDEHFSSFDRTMAATPASITRVDHAGSTSQSVKVGGSTGSFEYCPGVFSGRVPQSAKKPRGAAAGDANTSGVASSAEAVQAASDANVNAESVESSPDSEFAALTRPKTSLSTEPRRLNFSPAASPTAFSSDSRPSSAPSSNAPTPQQLVAPFGGMFRCFVGAFTCPLTLVMCLHA